MNKKQRKRLVRILATPILLLLVSFFEVNGFARLAAYLVPYIVVGYDVLKKAGRRIINRQIFDENFLMAIATLGAIIIGVIGDGDYIEAVAVMWFYQIGELFQSYAVEKSRKNITELMNIRPEKAWVEQGESVVEVTPEEVAIGTIIVLRPGDRVPLDGVVVEGASSLDMAALTGESLPKKVGVGDAVISGCINLNGLLKVSVTKEFGESTVSKILELVENAGSRKSKSEAFITRFARVYTPAVCYSAMALCVIPPIFSLCLHMDANWTVWAYRALSFLVASCPCALVISIPLTFFAGLGGAGKQGILIKGSNYLEALSKTKTVVFDKTGTLTEGVFEVVEIHQNTLSKEKIIELAVYAEYASTHPIADSLRRAYALPIDRSRVHSVQEIGGKGIVATVDGASVVVGNQKLMKQFSVEVPSCDCIGTVVYVALDKIYAGHIIISDQMKKNAMKTVSSLGSQGIENVVMLTGDTRDSAAKVAKKLGIKTLFSDLLPSDKVQKIEEMIEQKSASSTLVFVGDGINDAPVLTRADVGIAMGAMGSDAAIEAADVVLMDDDPMKVVKAIKISRKCMGIVYQNIVGAIAIKLLALLLVAVGVANMWIAIFADVGVMVLAILNAIRALFVKKI